MSEGDRVYDHRHDYSHEERNRSVPSGPHGARNRLRTRCGRDLLTAAETFGGCAVVTDTSRPSGTVDSTTTVAEAGSVPGATSVTVEACDDAAAWDVFVERHGGSPFTTWGWSDVVESYGPERHFLAAVVDGDIVGVAPLFRVRSLLFGDDLVAVPYASRGSLVLGDRHREAARDALLRAVMELADDLGVDVASLRGRDLGEFEAFEHTRQYVSFEVPLDRGPEAVWEGMKNSRQRHVNQAEEEGLGFRVAEDESDLRAFYDLYLRTMRGHGSPPHSFAFFRRLWDRLHDDGTMRVNLVEYDGRVINSTVDLAIGSRVYNWKAVSDYEYRDLQGGSYITWKAMEWAAGNGYSTYDLGRTREGSGVYTFKKSFGGEKVWMDDYHYFPDGEVDLPDPDQERYDLPRRLWRKLPLPVTRLVGPPIRKSISL